MDIDFNQNHFIRQNAQVHRNLNQQISARTYNRLLAKDTDIQYIWSLEAEKKYLNMNCVYLHYIHHIKYISGVFSNIHFYQHFLLLCFELAMGKTCLLKGSDTNLEKCRP